MLAKRLAVLSVHFHICPDIGQMCVMCVMNVNYLMINYSKVQTQKYVQQEFKILFLHGTRFYHLISEEKISKVSCVLDVVFLCCNMSYVAGWSHLGYSGVLPRATPIIEVAYSIGDVVDNFLEPLQSQNLHIVSGMQWSTSSSHCKHRSCIQYLGCSGILPRATPIIEVAYSI